MRTSAIVTAVALTLGSTVGTAQVRSVGNLDIPNIGGKAADPTKLICVTQLDTGSRLGGTKTCHTQADWAALKQSQRVNAARPFDSGHAMGCAPPRQC